MAYVNSTYDIKINIGLGPGTYVFVPNSAIGKSYLAFLLNKYKVYGEPVYAYSYADFEDGVRLADIIASKKYSVILLDRYDMYYGEALNLLQHPPDNVLLLVDTKRPYTSLRPKGFCAVVRRKGQVYVS